MRIIEALYLAVLFKIAANHMQDYSGNTNSYGIQHELQSWYKTL